LNELFWGQVTRSLKNTAITAICKLYAKHAATSTWWTQCAYIQAKRLQNLQSLFRQRILLLSTKRQRTAAV